MKAFKICLQAMLAAAVMSAGTVAFAATTVTEKELDERDFHSSISLAGHLIGLQKEENVDHYIYSFEDCNYKVESVLNTYSGKTLLRVLAPNYNDAILADVVLNYWGMKPVYFDRDERLVAVNPGSGDGEACSMVVYFNQSVMKTIAVPKDKKGCFSYPNIKKQNKKNFWSGANTCFLVLAKSEQQYSVNGKTNVYYKIVGRDGKPEWVFGEDIILNKGIFKILPEEKL